MKKKNLFDSTTSKPSTKEILKAIKKAVLDFDSVDFTEADVLEGAKVELEHWDTVDRNLDMVIQIALDHINEDVAYYKKLAKMEGKS